MSQYMKSIGVLFFLALTGIQNLSADPPNAYDKLWKDYQKLENQGSYKDALAQAQKIYDKAVKDKNAEQKFKSLIHLYKNENIVEENSENNIINKLEKAVQNAQDADEKALLQMLLAHSYLTYYTGNQYKIISRTYSQDMADDFTLWDAKQFKTRIDQLLQAALKQSPTLRKTSLDSYTQIVVLNPKAPYQVPFGTLADLIYYEAIQYYRSDEIRLTEAAGEFEINRPEYFSDSKQFVQLKLTSSGEENSTFKALQILQNWLALHLNKDSELAAFIDDYRLDFIYDRYVGENKSSLYEKSLTDAFNFYTSKDSKALFQARKINLWHIDSENIFDKTPVQLHTLAKQVISQYPNTYGASLMQNLVTQLESKQLSVTLEGAVPALHPFKILVTYQNIQDLDFKIVAWDDNFYKDPIYKNEDIWAKTQKLKVVRKGAFQLPTSQDLLQHQIEFALRELPYGHYALIVSTKDINKNLAAGKFFISPFYVSNLAVSLLDKDSNIAIKVQDRQSGFPLTQSQVEVFLRLNYSDKYKSILTGFTDKTGSFSLPKSLLGKNASYYILVKKGTDSYRTPDQSFYKSNYKENKPVWQTQVQLYTDRAIYRPGQQVYFKGIAIDHKNDSLRITMHQEITVELLDANYQKIQSQKLSINDFGSFSGFFSIPTGGLNGKFSLRTDYGSTQISVEEYKRPTFEVKTSPIEGNFQLGDTIHIAGDAVAYSGAKISQAEIRYMVKRNGYFPIWRYNRRAIWPPYNNQPAVITSGTLSTDENGHFRIDFIASRDKNKLDYYQYEVSIEVVDITGEVRTTSTSIRVGKNGIQPQMTIASEVQPQTKIPLKLSSKNLQDKPVTSQFQVEIYQLIAPQTPKKSRLWATPDQFSMTEADYNKLFPYDWYQDEKTPSEWKSSAKPVLSLNMQVNGDSTFSIPANILVEGMYQIKAIVLDRTDTIRLENTFEVKSSDKPSIQPEFIKVTLEKPSYNPGESAHVRISSDLPEAYVYLFATSKNEVIQDTTIQLTGTPVTWSIPITEAMRGNVEIHYEMSAQNRDFSGKEIVAIPFKRPDALTYQWVTFRNKLLPGSHETWALHILDKNKQAADAELLVTMYDASLDQFLPHPFNFYLPYPYIPGYSRMINTNLSYQLAYTRAYTGSGFYKSSSYSALQFPQLNYFGWNLSPYGYRRYGVLFRDSGQMYMAKSAMPTPSNAGSLILKDNDQDGTINAEAKEEKHELGQVIEDTETVAVIPSISLRKNFRETVFFYPQLKKDDSGTYTFEFDMPEALTTWKLLALAHTKDLQHVLFQEQIVTQKDLMIQMNKPRFVRVGDEIYLKARVSNLTDQLMPITSTIKFRDAQTNQDITHQLLESDSTATFSLAGGQNGQVEWKIKIPTQYSGLIYEIVAQSANQKDGESDLIPVLENRMLLTESYPFFLRQKDKKFEFDLNNKKINTATSKMTSITFEYTSKPVWQALLALPFLNEQNNESANILFQRFYAQSLTAFILKSIPESQNLLDAWKKEGSLKSGLEKNQELKSVVLEATPWLRDAQDETQQMQELYKLFDDSKDYTGREKLLKQLQLLQDASGGISWYPGMPANRYMTQDIILGFYRLQHLGVLDISKDQTLKPIVDKALTYLDNELTKQYQRLKIDFPNYLSEDHLGYLEIHYLLLLSHLNKSKLTEAEKYYFKQAQAYALNKNNYAKAAIALALNRLGDKKTPDNILYSLKQSAVMSQKLGMYWKYNTSYYWYQAPIETQALIIQAFDEIAHDDQTVDELKIWLLTQKQTSRWNEPTATVDACYALLLTGGDWKTNKKSDLIYFDKQKQEDKLFSPGLGYLKKTWNMDSTQKAPDKIEIRKKVKGPSWGAVYYQYWEDLDQVKASTNDLQVKRTLYKVQQNAQGDILIPITEQSPLHLGDKVRVKLEIKIDRDMEFFHLQDTRGAGFEPTTVLSQYKYQGGLGYYEVTGDAAMHWYMDRIQKGTYVFEYTNFVNIAGSYSSGVTTGECLYAPEFRFQSGGQRIQATH